MGLSHSHGAQGRGLKTPLTLKAQINKNDGNDARGMA
jgi:hypothetical protein